MPIDTAAVLDRLKQFDFSGLFTQDLGWDFPPANTAVFVAGQRYALRAVTQKKGFVVYECPITAGEPLPDSSLGRKIDRELTKQTHEHMIIFTDERRTTQIWQWVKRDPGVPIACRRHTFHTSQSGESLIQKLDKLFVSLDEEEGFSIVHSSGRVRAAFDVERVTKRFYERFREEHSAFLKFIKGLPRDEEREWYASLMLNRLMFIYFIQKKGFLDGDRGYLRKKLAEVRLRRGKDKFHSFYRDFLLRLFHDGLGSQHRDAELEELLGRVPFLNGGLFEVHQLENDHPDLAIPDNAFDRLFSFFDDYQWHLDERPLRRDDEINPDVLGYIFEKYINQKQMGAYYTKEDITDYISKNTIIPYLFDAVKKKRPTDFRPDAPVWQLLRDSPDRYLYPAMREGVVDKHGQIIELPPEIAAGIGDVEQRGGWNRAAPAPFALPTETWREHVARRQRCLELREKLRRGEIHEINDLITYNLDIRQFAEDAVAGCDDEALLRAFYSAVSTVTVLDPTCGSGAFLFAALNVLEPLYNACLERMEEFVEELDAASPKRPKKLEDFRTTLAEVGRHPNRAYFVLKSIILGNIYGVDIMEEAVEICKLRLFLRLASQVNPDFQHPNLGIEPLPDIDFNIRAGNTLVGFATLDEVKQTLVGTLGFSKDAVAEIFEDAEIIDRQCQMFHRQQTEIGGHVAPEDKAENRARLARLAEKLNRHLAREYRVDPDRPRLFDAWRTSHQPFHWCAEFYRQMASGGFDVIIGNPPWVEYRIVSGTYQVRGYESARCNNLWAYVVERSFRLLGGESRCGLIVPMSLSCTERMVPIQTLIRAKGTAWISNFESDSNPGQLFDGVKQNVSILLYSPDGARDEYVTRLNRFFSEARDLVLSMVRYAHASDNHLEFGFPKISDDIENAILAKLFAQRPLIEQMARNARRHIYVHRIAHYYIKCFDFVPYFKSDRDGVKKSEDYKEYSLATPIEPIVAVINSSLFYFYWQVFFDAFKAGKRCVEGFPLDDLNDDRQLGGALTEVCRRLMRDMKANAIRLRAKYAATGQVEYDQFIPRRSKVIMDIADTLLQKQLWVHG